MSKTSAIVTATDPITGKTLQKTLTDLNPDCSNEVIAAFGAKLNAITGNTYVRTDRVDKTNCDLESGGGLTTPTLYFTCQGNTVTELTWQDFDDYGATVNYNGDGKLYTYMDVPANTDHLWIAICGGVLTAKRETFSKFESITEAEIEVYAPATDTCKAVSATIRITDIPAN